MFNPQIKNREGVKELPPQGFVHTSWVEITQTHGNFEWFPLFLCVVCVANLMTYCWLELKVMTSWLQDLSKKFEQLQFVTGYNFCPPPRSHKNMVFIAHYYLQVQQWLKNRTLSSITKWLVFGRPLVQPQSAASFALSTYLLVKLSQWKKICVGKQKFVYRKLSN